MKRVFRPRVLVYGALLAAISAALVTALFLRTPFKVDVIRDRAALARETRDGLIENVYRLQIMNTEERAHRYVVSATGLAGLKVVARQPVEVPGATTQAVAVAVQLDPAGVKPGSHPIVFRIEDADEPRVNAEETSRFFVR